MLAFAVVATSAGEVAAVIGAVGSSRDELELYLALMALAWLVGMGSSLGLIRAIRR
jgi:hypothetical protein